MWVDSEDAHSDDASATPPPQGLVDGVAEGVVSFSSKSFTSYRYIISLKNDKVQIWLEDRKSKKQWDTGALSQDDIVKSDAVIAHAKLPDYVQCFYSCLSAPRSDETSDFQRDLLDLPDDQLLLELSLKLRVFTSTWTTRYTFVLLLVELKPLDVLSAKVRDLKDENTKLRLQLADLRDTAAHNAEEMEALRAKSHEEAVVFIHAITATTAAPDQFLIWEWDENSRGDDFVDLLESGSIRFLTNGVYDLHVSVVNEHTSNSEVFWLLINGTTTQKCFGCSSNGRRQTSTMRRILTVKAGDEIAFKFMGNYQAHPGSYLVMNLLGFK